MNEIETARLLLTPFTSRDYELFHSLSIDPYIKKYLWDNKDIDLDTAKEIVEHNDHLFSTSRAGIWKVRLKETGEIIGYTGLWTFFDESQPQLIYALLEKFGKKGYATEFASAIVNYSFNVLGYKYLMAATDGPHRASQKLAERIGMVYLERRIENDQPTLFYRIENKSNQFKNDQDHRVK